MSNISLYNSKNRHATWLELFFDLVFVAVIGVVTHDLAHTHDKHIGVDQILRFPLVFVPVWWIWMSHTLYANRFDDDSRFHRFFSLLIMAVMVLFSTFAETSLTADFVPFALLYTGVRLMTAYLYWTANKKASKDSLFAQHLGKAILIGAVISASSTLLPGISKFIVFYAGIAVDMIWQISIRRAHSDRPADRVHLVERIGLLAIIILGESMIAMVGALSDQSWQMNHLATSVTGFLLIGAIWWVYFDSFPILERAKRLTSSNTLIFTHLLLCMGLLILANMIRHAILGDLDQFTFGLLSITGLLLFYLGKQIPYWYAFPPWRSAIVTNTLVCVSITVASSFLPELAYSLMGMTFGMLVYVWLTFKRILSVNVDEYLDPEHH